MKQQRKIRFLYLALLILFIGSACSSKKNNNNGQPQGSTDAKKIFYHFRSSAHKTLDPMMQFDAASADIIRNVYDTLIEYHYLKRPYELIPGLLEKMPEKQNDGLSYVFTLRKGVRFTNDPCFKQGKGREVTADDAIYSIKRFSDANINQLSYVLLKGFVVGLDDFRAQTKKLGKNIKYDKHLVAGLKKLDKYRFIIQFTRNNPLALYPFAFSGMSIVPHEAVTYYGEKFKKHPVGTGPFYMKKYSRRGKMVLAKNQNYFGVYPTAGDKGDEERGLLADKGKKLPLIDEVHLPLIEESQPAMLKFLDGELAWIGMNKDDFARMAFKDENNQFKLKQKYAKQFNMYTEAGLYAGYLAFNLKDELVGKNKNLRQAIAYALDTNKWIELMRNGRGLKLNSIVPHPIAGSEKHTGFKYYEQNLEKARQHLSKAGYPNGEGLPAITMAMIYIKLQSTHTQKHCFLRCLFLIHQKNKR